MEMWIPGDRLGTERVPVSTEKEQTFSMVTGDYMCISGRAKKSVGEFISSVELSVQLWSVNSGQRKLKK
jgi:hypothetical protein